jgi:hypothetical protein
MSSIEALKRNRQSTFQKLNQELEKASGKFQGNKDERFWYPARDKTGNGYAVIRFLPAPDGEDVPFVKIFEHGFKGPTGSWYIEKSLTTLEKDDPVSTHNSLLWNTGIEANKKIASAQKRKLVFISNILVLEDPQTPENEGKVFLFRYGKKIYDKIFEAYHPITPTEKPINAFDFWEGANFKLKIRKVEGQTNYDSSSFTDPSVLSKDEAELEKIWSQAYSLKEFVDPKNFKSYEELERRLKQVLGEGSAPRAAPKPKVDEESTPAPWESEVKESPDVFDGENEDFLKNLLNDE